uniref:Protein S100 n=1 Tax=Scophthalmus maximus TaxID=52904 RepID=A0A8D3AYT8_SCOMX
CYGNVGVVVNEHFYAAKEGDSEHLSKNELKSLLKKEFPNLMQCSNDPAAIDQIMETLDQNQDKKVDFMEYSLMLITMTQVCKLFLQ